MYLRKTPANSGDGWDWGVMNKALVESKGSFKYQMTPKGKGGQGGDWPKCQIPVSVLSNYHAVSVRNHYHFRYVLLNCISLPHGPTLMFRLYFYVYLFGSV